MTRIVSDTYVPLVNEGSPLAYGAAYLNGVTCIFYVTPIFQLRVRAYGNSKIFELRDNVTWVSVMEDKDDAGFDVARVYFSTAEGGNWVLTYREFGSNNYSLTRLALRSGTTKVRQLCAIKHTLVYPAILNTPDRMVYVLMTDNGVVQVAHMADDFEFSQRYSSRTGYNNDLDPLYIVNSPTIGFHPDDPLRLQVAVQRLERATLKKEIGVYVMSYDDRDKW
jgi:hypothetical protein